MAACLTGFESGPISWHGHGFPRQSTALSGLGVTADIVVITNLLDSLWSTTARVCSGGVVSTGGELCSIIVDADEATGANLEATASFRCVTGAGVIAEDLVGLVDIGRRIVPAITFGLIFRAREGVLAVVTSSLTSLKSVLIVGIYLGNEQSSSRFVVVVASQVTVHLLTCRIRWSNLTRYHGSCNLNFMDPEIDVVGIQSPCISESLIRSIRLLSVGNEKNGGICALIDRNVLRLVKSIGVLRPEKSIGRFALRYLQH